MYEGARDFEDDWLLEEPPKVLCLTVDSVVDVEFPFVTEPLEIGWLSEDPDCWNVEMVTDDVSSTVVVVSLELLVGTVAVTVLELLVK